jgi:hypothetical protein
MKNKIRNSACHEEAKVGVLVNHHIITVTGVGMAVSCPQGWAAERARLRLALQGV